jgi:protein-disulfide isomerase
MKLIAIVVVAGCGSNNLEKKVDDLAAQLAATNRDVAALRERVDHPPRPADDQGDRLRRKLDDIDRKIDQLGAAGPRPSPRPPRVEPDRTKVYAIAVDGYPSEGPADAKVTLVMAMDYTDPYGEKTRQTLRDLRKKYGNDLRIVYRSVVVHPQTGTSMALAACAAARQNKFAAFHELQWDKGFKERRFDQDAQCWDAIDGCPVALGFAVELKLNAKKFKADMHACVPLQQADQNELQAFGIAAVPSWFINGRFMSGAMPIDQFEQLIDEELKKATERGTPKARYYKDWVLAKGLKKLETP